MNCTNSNEMTKLNDYNTPQGDSIFTLESTNTPQLKIANVLVK